MTDNLLAKLQISVITLVTAGLMLFMGGVHVGPRTLATLTLALLFLLTVITRLISGSAFSLWDRAWLWPWLAVTVWIALQLVPLPPSLLVYVGAYPVEWFTVWPELPLQRLSPMPLETLSYWTMFTAYWVTTWLVASLQRQHLAIVLGMVIGLVAFQATYGFIAHIGRFETVLGLWPAGRNHSVVVGTFWNRNHIAGLLAMGWPLGIGFLLFSTHRYRHRIHELRYLLVVLFALIIALALFNTLSRLGTVAGLFGLAVFVLVARWQRGGTINRLEQFWLLCAALVALGLSISFGLAPLLGRYADLMEFEAGARAQALLTVFDLPAKAWLLGIGAGAFEDVFKLVQPASMVGSSYYYLHNDWVQFVLEFGVLGTLAVLSAAVLWWRQVKPQRFNRLRAAAVGSIAAIGLHSIGDFNLQIPGTAIVFWIILGVLCNPSLEPRPTPP